MADVGDEGRFGHCAGLGAVARLYGFQLLALQPHDQHIVFVAQVNAFIQQARHAVAIACQHRGEQHDQDGGHGGVQPALPQQQADQRPQREEGMGDIGRAMGGAGDELRRRHAQIGQAQIGLGGKGIPDKPEHRRRAPGGAGNGRHKRVAPRPEMRIAAGRAVLVGGGELLGGDHHRHLQQQRHQRQDARLGAREQGGRHAQNREGQGEIVAAERVQDIDTPGEHRVGAFLLRRLVQAHCANPCASLAFAPFRNA